MCCLFRHGRPPRRYRPPSGRRGTCRGRRCRCNRPNPRSPRAIKQLSSVLSFLQKNNICHRDIKPQNILVFKNDVYKLADFGEAKQLIDIKKNLTNYSLRGTELYMSPLLFNGLRNGQIDIKHNVFKSDVYSLGLCVLFAAVTKNRPLYEIRKYIDMKDTRKYLEKIIKGKYSCKFINLLCNMIEIHEKNRPDFIELEKIMKKWK